MYFRIEDQATGQGTMGQAREPENPHAVGICGFVDRPCLIVDEAMLEMDWRTAQMQIGGYLPCRRLSGV